MLDEVVFDKTFFAMVTHLVSPYPVLLFFIVIFALPLLRVHAFGDTDSITWGGDYSRTGYQKYVWQQNTLLAFTHKAYSNHNLDPNTVRSTGFGQIFKTTLPGNFNGLAAEQIFASPLVYTEDDGIQYLYVATTQNNLYKIDAKTGVIVASRNLHVPFLQADLESRSNGGFFSV